MASGIIRFPDNMIPVMLSGWELAVSASKYYTAPKLNRNHIVTC